LIATLHDPAVIRKILAHLALCHSGPSPGPGPPESGAAASWSDRVTGAADAVVSAPRGHALCRFGRSVGRFTAVVRLA